MAPDPSSTEKYLREINSSTPYSFSHSKNNFDPKYLFTGKDVSDQTVAEQADYILYCVDLSTPIDLGELNETLKNISQTTSAAWVKAASQSIILVGTKSDRSDQTFLEAFKSYKFSPQCNIIPAYITSVTDKTGVAELKDELFNLVQNKHWNKAVAELQSRLETRTL